MARVRREASTRELATGAALAKINSLVDQTLIEELYAAGSRCADRPDCPRYVLLRPGVPGLSEHIRVISIIDPTWNTRGFSTSECRGAGVFPRLRGLDAAQPRSSCRDCLSCT